MAYLLWVSYEPILFPASLAMTTFVNVYIASKIHHIFTGSHSNYEMISLSMQNIVENKRVFFSPRLQRKEGTLRHGPL